MDTLKVKFSLKNRHEKGINHILMIYAFFDVLKARRNFFVAKVNYEPRTRGCWRPHKQKDFSFTFFYLFKRLIFTKYSLATSSAGLPFAPTSKFIWLISSSEIFPAN